MHVLSLARLSHQNLPSLLETEWTGEPPNHRETSPTNCQTRLKQTLIKSCAQDNLPKQFDKDEDAGSAGTVGEGVEPTRNPSQGSVVICWTNIGQRSSPSQYYHRHQSTLTRTDYPSDTGWSAGEGSTRHALL